MTTRGDVWANFDQRWPGLGGGPFAESPRWDRLGEVPNDQAAFWKAVRLQQFNGSGWERTVDFYVLVHQASPALPRLQGEAEPRPFWLGLDVHGGGTKLYVSSAPVGPGSRLRRPPERHPGLLGPPTVPLALRLTLSNGTYFDNARPNPGGRPPDRDSA